MNLSSVYLTNMLILYFLLLIILSEIEIEMKEITKKKRIRALLVEIELRCARRSCGWVKLLFDLRMELLDRGLLLWLTEHLLHGIQHWLIDVGDVFVGILFGVIFPIGGVHLAALMNAGCKCGITSCTRY